MEAVHVEFLLAVASAGAIAAAADVCGVSERSLRRGLARLSAEFGGDLVAEDRGRAELTPFGRRFAPQLRRSLAAGRAARALAMPDGLAGAGLRLGVSASLASPSLIDTIETLFRSHGLAPGGVHLAAPARLLEGMTAGRIDVVISEGELPAGGQHDAWRLCACRFAWMTTAQARLARRPDVSLLDISRERWIDGGDEGSGRLKRAAARRGLPQAFDIRARNARDLHALIRAGRGGAVLAQSMRPAGDIVALPLRETEFQLPVRLVAARGRPPSLAAEAFIRSARARTWADC